MTLRLPNPAFHWKRETWGDALCCAPLERVAQHLFTTRQLQLPAPDTPERAWQRVLTSLNGSPDRLLRVRQVHGRTVRVVRAAEFDAGTASLHPAADAIVSDVGGAVLAVQVADCIPMLMVDRKTGVSAAVHAGWRGTCAGIVRATVETLQQEFESNPSDLLVALGPSIGACCYEVGPELADAFRAAGATEAQVSIWFSRTPDGSLMLDLWQVNRDHLAGAGVAPDHVYLAGLCTRTFSDVFDSYRAAGARAGRSIAAVKVPRV